MNLSKLPTSPDGTDWGIYGDTPREQWNGVLFEAEKMDSDLYGGTEDLIIRLESHIEAQSKQIVRLRVENQELRDQIDRDSMPPEFRQPLKDITTPKHGVQVEICNDGRVLWVHVDGITVLRICQIPKLTVEDNR
jgi:hypothetical protein